METRSAKRKRLLSAAVVAAAAMTNHGQIEHDLISDLPDDILHRVFTLLPIKSVAQTSVLSKRWRNLFLTFPDLDFTTVGSTLTNATLFKPFIVRKKLSPSAVRSDEFMDHILHLLDKHSDIGLLRIRAFITCYKFAVLIRHAVKHNVRELDMEVSTTEYLNFPLGIVRSRSLRVLRLKSWNPGLRLPLEHYMRDGFQSLTVLSLSRTVVHDQPSLVDLFTGTAFPLLRELHLDSCLGLKQLRIDCHGLRSLRLEGCKELQKLEITAMRLEKLTVSSCFDGNCSISGLKIETPALKMMYWRHNAVTEKCRLENLTSMEEASLEFIPNEELSPARTRSLYELIAGISNCGKLILGKHCMKILSKPNKFSAVSLSPFSRLKSLSFSTGFNKDECTGMARVFQSSPIIHTIVINIICDQNTERRKVNKNALQILSSGDDIYWESRTESLKSFLHNLKVVNIHGFTECTHRVSLVRFLLKHANVLEEILLCTTLAKQHRDALVLGKMKEQILGFSRASPNTSIVFK